MAYIRLSEDRNRTEMEETGRWNRWAVMKYWAAECMKSR